MKLSIALSCLFAAQVTASEPILKRSLNERIKSLRKQANHALGFQEENAVAVVAEEEHPHSMTRYLNERTERGVCQKDGVRIRNPGFQERDHANSRYSGGGAPGWERFGNGDGGDWDYTSHFVRQFAEEGIEEQVAWINTNAGKIAGLRQTLADKFDASTDYELSFDVGNRNDGGNVYDTNYEVRLLAGDTIVGVFGGRVSEIPGGVFATHQIIVHSGYEKLHGQNLVIELVNIGPEASANKGVGQVNFDNVKLFTAKNCFCESYPIKVRNAGFQERDHANNNHAHNGVPGWTYFGTGGGGDWDFNGQYIRKFADDEVEEQVSWLNAKKGQVSGFKQELDTPYRPAFDYTLSFDVGNRNDGATNLDTMYEVRLLAGETVFGVMVGKVSDIPNGVLARQKLMVNAGYFALDGKKLSIQLLNVGPEAQNNHAHGIGQVNFDNIRLEASLNCYCVREKVQVRNPGFQLRDHANNNHAGGIHGWEMVGIKSGGDWDYNDHHFVQKYADSGLEQQVAWINAQPGKMSGIRQIMPEPFDSSVDYLLSFDVGNRYDGRTNLDTHYEARILAGETVVGVFAGRISDIPQGVFETHTVRAFAGFTALNGLPLGIELMNLGPEVQNNHGHKVGQVNFDNVELYSAKNCHCVRRHISIENPGFQVRNHGDGGYTGGAPGWEYFGNGGGGDWDPNGHYMRKFATSKLEEQVAWLNARPGQISGFKQVVGKFDSSLTYELSLDVGNRNDGATNYDTKYEVRLYAGETVIGTFAGKISDIPNGVFATLKVRVFAGFDALNGEALAIEVRNIGPEATSNRGVGQVNFDNVRLMTALNCGRGNGGGRGGRGGRGGGHGRGGGSCSKPKLSYSCNRPGEAREAPKYETCAAAKGQTLDVGTSCCDLGFDFGMSLVDEGECGVAADEYEDTFEVIQGREKIGELDVMCDDASSVAWGSENITLGGVIRTPLEGNPLLACNNKLERSFTGLPSATKKLDVCWNRILAPRSIERPPRVPKVCKATAWGDPHIVTFDGLKFDAQPQGEIIFVRDTDSKLEVQGRTKKINANAAVTTGLAMRGTDDSHPIIQVSMATVAGAPKTVTSLQRVECPVELYIDGEKLNAIQYDGGEGNPTVRLSGSTITVGYPDLLLVSMKVSFYANTCYFSLDVSLLDCEPLEDSVIGLMGSPNGNGRDDWMKKDGSVIPIPSGASSYFFGPAFKYTKENWVITEESESLFDYEKETKFADVSDPEETYDPTVEEKVKNADPEVKRVCGDDVGCLVDGVTLGKEAAEEFLSNPATKRVMQTRSITREPDDEEEEEEEICEEEEEL